MSTLILGAAAFLVLSLVVSSVRGRVTCHHRTIGNGDLVATGRVRERRGLPFRLEDA